MGRKGGAHGDEEVASWEMPTTAAAKVAKAVRTTLLAAHDSGSWYCARRSMPRVIWGCCC